MPNLKYNKRKGADFEQEVADYLRGHGFPYAERRHLAGSKDMGDIAGTPLVWEAKNIKYAGLSIALDEAILEASHANVPLGVVIKKRPRKPVGDAYVVLRMSDFVDLLNSPNMRIAVMDRRNSTEL